MSSPSLSLCIPAHNAAGHLPRLLRSARDQTGQFDEVLVYDDCSTDETAEVAQSYGATVISGDENQGCSVARKRLAECATTDWVHFHDADDELLPNFVEQAQEWMVKKNPPDVVLFAYEYRDNQSGELISTAHFDAGVLRTDPIEYTIRKKINPFCGIYKRASFLEAGGPDTDPKVLYNEDCAMHCKLARAGLQFDADQTVTVINYKREGSMSRSNRVKCQRSRFYVLKKCAEHNGDTHGPTIARQLWENAGLLAAHLQWDLADRAVQLAIELGGKVPRHGGALFRVLATLAPHFALRAREWRVRFFKPKLRKNSRYGSINFI